VEALGNVSLQEYRRDGIPSLLVLPNHTETPEVLLCGHLDVISHPDIQVYRSHVADGRIYGPGAGDMKGPLAILLEIFRAFHSRYTEASVGLLVTSDEESGGMHGVRYLFDEVGLRCGVAMIPDGGSLNEVTVEEKGVAHVSLHIHGHAAHAARPWLGTNALEHLSDRLVALRRHFEGFRSGEDHWYPTCSLTILKTPNDTANRVPAEAEAVIDVRFPPPYTVEKILAEIGGVLGPDIEVRALLSAEPVHLSPDPLYLAVTEEITGEPATLVREPGGSDGRFICPYGIPVLMSRPRVGEVHAEDEWIDVDSMVTFYRIYERYLERKLIEAERPTGKV
jgi:succinyl-diaminopimelate desuccinylase